MTGHLPKEQENKAGDNSGSELDLETIAAFAAAVVIDEISFREWKSTHSSLDLTVPMFLSALEAKDGLQRQLKWTRTIHEPGSQKPTRQLLCKLFTVPPNTKHQWRFIFPNEGDQRGAARGDLIVAVFIRQN